MITDLEEIKKSIIASCKAQVPPLRIKNDVIENFELSGRKEVMQGRKMVDGIFFSAVVPKAKDIRLYFFPIYTHADAFSNLSEELRKSLKGKSCFHIKKMSNEMEAEIKEMIKKGVELYKEEGLI